MRYLLSLALLLSLPAWATDATWPDLSTPLSASAGDGSEDAALVIGIQDYGAVDDVLGARDNAGDWYRWLVKARGVPLENVHRLLDRQAVDHKIRSELTAVVSEVQPGGTLWVVFIGHGAPSRDGQDGLLVGADADRSADGIYQRSVSRSQVLAAIELGAQSQAVVVLDACFSGQGQTGRALVDGLQSLVPTSARANNPRVTVLTGAGSGEFAGRLSGTTRPAFSYLVLGALRGWGDSAGHGDGDGRVSAAEVLRYTTGALRATVTGRTQTPSLSGPDGALSRGREAGPDLVELALVQPAPLSFGAADVELGGDAVDFASLAARAQAADAAALRAAQAKKAAQAAFEKGRRRQLDEAAGSIRAAATRDYASISGLVSSPGESGRAVLEAYVARYGGAKVTVEGVSEPVAIAELSKVQAPLSALAGTSAPGSSRYEMVRIPAGSFVMGSPGSEPGRDSDETQHTVRISRAFLLGKTEVTQGLWAEVMGDNPSFCKYKGVDLCEPDYLVQQVSWEEAVGFANTLSRQEGLPECYGVSGKKVSWPKGLACTGYRLPTESEWEYAGRAGEHELYAGTESSSAVCRFANVATRRSKAKFDWSWDVFPCEDEDVGLAPVASYAANAWGLHDMIGNVWEWTWDLYGAYPTGAVTDPTDPTGASTGSYRVPRGGRWNNNPRGARLANRSGRTPGYRNNNLGLRLARSLP